MPSFIALRTRSVRLPPRNGSARVQEINSDYKDTAKYLAELESGGRKESGE
ncbi:MAG: hypothetical protein AB1715_02575 [Acidobacteriota bacterium]